MNLIKGFVQELNFWVRTWKAKAVM
ncbi:hypothetical protein S40285_10831 [Stachybotrys chlorohalonatus IBT 40285]|uniref:Uncharacterized protein n=1 Tax=Stachybotrys chlorohalonatus (strain IBT 40285) TaxID=1283841 RepID=A0A084QX71_STAC4|nr:hypothetical protein S40285_10831 [Stachybotrys chlorohalonata IBT 40285]